MPGLYRRHPPARRMPESPGPGSFRAQPAQSPALSADPRPGRRLPLECEHLIERRPDIRAGQAHEPLQLAVARLKQIAGDIFGWRLKPRQCCSGGYRNSSSVASGMAATLSAYDTRLAPARYDARAGAAAKRSIGCTGTAWGQSGRIPAESPNITVAATAPRRERCVL